MHQSRIDFLMLLCVMIGAMHNYYADILVALVQAKVRFVVAGGIAAVLHGVERMTMDIDLAVDMSPDNLERFVRVMHDLSLRPNVPVPAEFIMDPENVRRIVEEKNAIVFTFIDPNNPLKHVDLFLTANHSYANLFAESITIEILGRPVRIVSKKKLLKLKRSVAPPRPKDLHDIAELERLLEEDDA